MRLPKFTAFLLIFLLNAWCAESLSQHCENNSSQCHTRPYNSKEEKYASDVGRAVEAALRMFLRMKNAETALSKIDVFLNEPMKRAQKAADDARVFSEEAETISQKKPNSYTARKCATEAKQAANAAFHQNKTAAKCETKINVKIALAEKPSGGTAAIGKAQKEDKKATRDSARDVLGIYVMADVAADEAERQRTLALAAKECAQNAPKSDEDPCGKYRKGIKHYKETAAVSASKATASLNTVTAFAKYVDQLEKNAPAFMEQLSAILINQQNAVQIQNNFTKKALKVLKKAKSDTLEAQQITELWKSLVDKELRFINMCVDGNVAKEAAEKIYQNSVHAASQEPRALKALVNAILAANDFEDAAQEIITIAGDDIRENYDNAENLPTEQTQAAEKIATSVRYAHRAAMASGATGGGGLSDKEKVEQQKQEAEKVLEELETNLKKVATLEKTMDAQEEEVERIVAEIKEIITKTPCHKYNALTKEKNTAENMLSILQGQKTEVKRAHAKLENYKTTATKEYEEDKKKYEEQIENDLYDTALFTRTKQFKEKISIELMNAESAQINAKQGFTVAQEKLEAAKKHADSEEHLPEKQQIINNKVEADKVLKYIDEKLEYVDTVKKSIDSQHQEVRNIITEMSKLITDARPTNQGTISKNQQALVVLSVLFQLKNKVNTARTNLQKYKTTAENIYEKDTKDFVHQIGYGNYNTAFFTGIKAMEEIISAEVQNVQRAETAAKQAFALAQKALEDAKKNPATSGKSQSVSRESVRRR